MRHGPIELFIAILVLFSALFPFHADAADTQTPLADSVRPLVDRQELAGAVMLIAEKEKILALEAVGFADVAAQKPMQTDSLFWIASQSKPMTATALMMLVDEGKVRPDDPVVKYLPEFQGQMFIAEKDQEHVLLKKLSHPILVRNLLSHTAGLPFASGMERPTLDRFPLADRVHSYAIAPLESEPNTRYRYSNAGINTVGRIIEVISNMKYEDFMEQRLFKPLGMNDTTFWPNRQQLARLAKSYKPGHEGVGLEETPISQLHYPLDDRENRYPMPAGGLFSSAKDIMKFYQMLLGGGQLDGRRYLSEEAINTMTGQQTPLAKYGFGFQTKDQSVGHGGAYGTNSYIDTEHGLIFIWLIQHAGFAGEGAGAQGRFRQAAIKRFGK